MTLKWKDLLTGNKEGVIQVNVHRHVAPATLEAIGEGAFSQVNLRAKVTYPQLHRRTISCV